MFSRVFRSSLVISLSRNYSYKPIKRPSLNTATSKAFVEQKLKEYDLEKVLKTQIEATGPITGNLQLN